MLPVEARLQLLELFRPEVHFVCAHLERHFLNQAIVLDERPRKIANLCQALQNHLAIGYKLIVVRKRRATAATARSCSRSASSGRSAACAGR